MNIDPEQIHLDSPDRENGPSAKQFRMLVDGVIDYSIYMLSPQGLISSWNSGGQRIKGYQAKEVIGRHFSLFFTPDDQLAGKPDQAVATATAAGRFEAEDIRVRKDGSRFWAHVIMDAITDNDGCLVGFAKITRDITRQKQDADRLQEITQTLDLALSNMVQGLCLFDADGRLLLSNQRTNEIFGVAANTIMPGISFADLTGALMAGAGRQNDISTRVAVELIVRRHQDLVRRGERRAVSEQVGKNRTVSIMHRGLAGGGWLTTFEDITDRRCAELKIAHMARHDGLTGLPNRLDFNDYLEVEMQKAEHHQQQVGVIGIDLDRFKEINDLHGHAIGDAVLTTLAARMGDLLQEDEFVARLGGDELVRRLETCLLSPLVIENLKIGTGASLGVAIFPKDAGSAEQLVKNADLAMYRAKGAFERSVCYYEAHMEEVVRAKRAMASELWRAVKRQEFLIAYQVQKSVATDETVGYEALLRWKHPERGWISPDEFIPVAEECGAIIPIGEWVLRQACRDAASWPNRCKVAINVSPLQLKGSLPFLVKEALAESMLEANRLEVEITESAIISDKIKTLAILQQIKALGVTICLDDFGTGYSSLDTLRSFHFDKLKLDRTFLEEVTQSVQAKSVIRAILALGHSLSIPVLAEGVETEDQLAFLCAEGCDEAQGFLLGLPKIGGSCG
jgi:PAS domain S-box-containing protein